MTVDGPVMELTDRLLGLTAEDVDDDASIRLDAVIRTSLLSVGIGATTERAVAPALPEAFPKRVGVSTDLFSAMTTAYMTALLGAATDLDALDAGPAHCALTAVVAALVAGSITASSSDEIALSVLVGIEAGSRLRSALADVRPGAGFHSVAVFGTTAAAAAAGRALRLSSTEMAHALGIAVSRAAGLSANSAATELGLTHFGWAAAHGLEAAWLARDGMKASLDIGQALGVFYPSAAVSVADLGADALMGLRRTYFKHFPCNVYLNLIVLALAEGEAREADTLAVELPAVRHLDVPAPTSVRQARNSAQAVAAASARGAPTYRTFSAPELDLATNAPLAELARRVTVSMPPDRPTDLGRASVRVHAVRGRHVLLDHTVHATALAPYGRAHAEHLVSGLGLDDWVTTLYGAEYRRAADLAFDRVLSTAQVEV